VSTIGRAVSVQNGFVPTQHAFVLTQTDPELTTQLPSFTQNHFVAVHTDRKSAMNFSLFTQF
jgi:hypothetical protein